jgi:hypothetical protein
MSTELTAVEIGQYLNLSPARVRQLLSDHGIAPYRKVGNAGVYRRSQIEPLKRRVTKRGPVPKWGSKKCATAITVQPMRQPKGSNQ